MELMTKKETVQARLDSDVKKQANLILEKMGLDTSTAINMFYHQIINTGGIPFDVKLNNIDEDLHRELIRAEAEELGLMQDSSYPVDIEEMRKKYNKF